MSFAQQQSQITYQTLKQSQRQELRQLQKLRTETIWEEGELPSAVPGLEGIRVAHQILVERQGVGVLIGGLSEEIWGRNTTEEQLLQHKDVDVLVVTEGFHLNEPFEGGIDWWLPMRARVQQVGDISTIDMHLQWWENGYGVPQPFQLSVSEAAQPGLYFPDSDEVVDMQVEQARANFIRKHKHEPDNGAMTVFRQGRRRAVKRALM